MADITKVIKTGAAIATMVASLVLAAGCSSTGTGSCGTCGVVKAASCKGQTCKGTSGCRGSSSCK